MAAALSARRALAAAALALGCATPAPEAMTQQRLEAAIGAVAQNLRGSAGALEFEFDGVAMACFSDVAQDRVRLVAPIVAAERLSPQVLEVVLLANFHTALDARYAIGDDVLYAAYLHPLSSLSDAQLSSALRQVASLAKTFGSSYSSGEPAVAESGGREL